MFERLTIIGAGVMGSGIAQQAAEAGLKNIVVADKAFDKFPGFLKSVQDKVKHGIFIRKYSDGEQKGKFVRRTRKEVEDLYNKIDWCDVTSKQFKAYLLQSTCVIEAVEENIEIKKELYRMVEQYLPSTSQLFTNTSVISIAKLADGLKRPDRFMGVHFFNPVPVMRPVEVITHKDTSVGTFKAACELIVRMNKIHVRAPDLPGFVANRLFVKEVEAFLEALDNGADFKSIDKSFTTGTWFHDPIARKIVDRFLNAARDLIAIDRGHELLGMSEEAFKKDVDELMRLGGALPMGPYELIGYADSDTDPKMQFKMGPARFTDHVGIDVALNCVEMLKEQEPDRWTIPPILQKMLSEGKKGPKSGEGFYEYADKVTCSIAPDKSCAHIGWTGKVLSQKIVHELGRAFETASEARAESVILDINRGRGADINEFLLALLDENAAKAAIDTWQTTILRVINYPGPVIATIKGSAFGGAYEFALACDYIVAEKKAKIGLVELQRGILPGGGGTQTLTRRVGEYAARQMILRGATIDEIDNEVGPPWVDVAVEKITDEMLAKLVSDRKNIKKKNRDPVARSFWRWYAEEKEIRELKKKWNGHEPESFELARNAIWYGNTKPIRDGIREDEFNAVIKAFRTESALKKIIEFFENK